MMEKTTSNNTWRTKGALASKEMYAMYKTMVASPVDYRTYKKILLACNVEFMRMLVEEGKEIRMPYLNMLKVRKRRMANVTAVDYGHLRKTGELKVYDNSHSDGYSARFHWTKSKAVVPGKSIYCFRAKRCWNRAITLEMKKPNGHVKYSEYAK